MQKRTDKWKKPHRARTERNRKREQKLEVFDLMFIYCICEKKKIHDVVLIRIRNKYNQAFTSVICSLDTNNKLYCKTSLWRLLYAALLVLGTF